MISLFTIFAYSDKVGMGNEACGTNLNFACREVEGHLLLSRDGMLQMQLQQLRTRFTSKKRKADWYFKAIAGIWGSWSIYNNNTDDATVSLQPLPLKEGVVARRLLQSSTGQGDGDDSKVAPTWRRVRSLWSGLRTARSARPLRLSC